VYAIAVATMRPLTAEEANGYLHSVGMQIGDWNQITDSGSQKQAISWVTYEAPKLARELLNFSRHVAGWLPSGAWKLVQLDNSTMFDPTEAAFVGRLMFGPDSHPEFSTHRSYLFDFAAGAQVRSDTELLLANLIFLFLLFESHSYIVSSGSSLGQILAVQDGSVHLGARDKSGSGAELLLRRFERDPLGPPKWVTDVIATK
jgi:hypothetical protein